ncbi:GspH/FimT family pseudopilin [Paucibacter soli]|uniref:GspH/FimT family pseudopilin n=1 Tax=Paucibacter soli TaxID=3133433 RepID=UPI003095319A
MRRTSNRGMTLVELMVTVAVVVILLVIAVPGSVDMFRRLRVEGVANELATDLQYARSESIRRREDVTLVSSADGSSYTLTGVPSATMLKTVTLPSGTSLSAAVTIRFESLRGSATATGTIDVSAAGSTGRLRLAVDEVGRVSTCVAAGTFMGSAKPC